MISLKFNDNIVRVGVILAFLFATGSIFAEVKLSDSLSLSGWVESSFQHQLDKAAEGADAGKATTMGLDEFETNLNFNSGSVSGQVDLSSSGGGVGVEQGFVSYSFSDGSLSDIKLNISAGRSLSRLGYEAYDSPNRRHRSKSEGIPYPGQQDGISLSLEPVDKVGVYVKLVSGSDLWGESTDKSLRTDSGLEAQVSLTPTEQINVRAGYAQEKIASAAKDKEPLPEAEATTDTTSVDVTRSMINGWAEYSQGALTVAGEVNILKAWGAGQLDGIHMLGTASYSLEDVISHPVIVAVRYSAITLDDKDDATDDSSAAITISPSYAASDDLTLRLELNQRLNAAEGEGQTQIALQSVYTF